MEKTKMHYLKQIRFYLHLANLILAWKSTKSAPLNGHYPKLQLLTDNLVFSCTVTYGSVPTFSSDIILGCWLGSKHQLTNCSDLTYCMVCVADHEGHGQGHVWVLEWQPSGTSDGTSCQENLEQATWTSHIADLKHKILKPLVSRNGLSLRWKAEEKKKTFSSAHCVSDCITLAGSGSKWFGSHSWWVCVLEDSKWEREQVSAFVFLHFNRVSRMFHNSLLSARESLFVIISSI